MNNVTTAQSLEIWKATLGMPATVPSWIVAVIGLFLIYILVILPSGSIMSFLDRKLSADFQARVGPNRAGPSGVLQPLADLLKLLQKKTSEQWTWGEALWLTVQTMALYSTVAVIPLGTLSVLVNTDMSAFLPFWAALVLAQGTMLLGFNQGSVPGWLGGVRVAAQALAGALPALVSILCAGVHAGGFRWTVLAASQGPTILHWTALSNPFQFIAFMVFVVSGLVLLGIPPMDGGLSNSDLQGGVASHLSGRRLTLFRLSRFYGFLLWSMIAVVLFLGAWSLPFGLSERLLENDQAILLQVLELSWLLAKTFLLMLIVVWIARVNPRGRVDQITDFSWKVLSPLSLVALIGSAFWLGWRALV